MDNNCNELNSVDSNNESAISREDNPVLDVESNCKPKLPYPKRVFFIIGNEFCERFNFYGLQTLFFVFLTDKFQMQKQSAVIQVAVFNMFMYFTCIIGGIISDSWLGRFKTILSLSIIYAIGSVLVAIGASLYLHFVGKLLFYVGLALIALGSGGIKPNVASFGGDQFKMPAQSNHLENFFSVFYLAINAGSLLSTLATPFLKKDLRCFGEDDCYPVALGLPAILMIFSIVIFVMGAPSYTHVPPSGNVLIKAIKCIWNAIRIKKYAKNDIREHFLDYSIEDFGYEAVNDTKCLLNILVLYLPLPFFWALYSQQGSYWVSQVGEMDMHLGSYKIDPEQFQVINPILIIAFIPLFDCCIYPVMNKIGIGRPLQRISIGGIVAAFAFLLSAILQFQIERHAKNTLSVLWQLPQIVAITAAEILFSITLLSFSFDQAPKSMKSAIQACSLLTVGFGNALLALISSVRYFEYQSANYILYECLMLADILVFMILAKRYNPNQIKSM